MPVNIVAALRDALVTNLTSAVDAALREVFSLETGVSSPAGSKRRPGRPPSTAGAKRRPRKEITRWVPNRQARRVPKFVEELTGFSLKNDIAEKYGDGAIFEKGKPAPKPLAGHGAPAGRAKPKNKKAKTPARKVVEKAAETPAA